MRVTDEDGVRTITFDRPGVMNAMNIEVAEDLADAVEEATPEEHDAIVITGDGPAFSAGGDIQAMQEREEGPHEAYQRVGDSFNRAAAAIMQSPVPVVAKINGDCVGAGLAIVAAADFAYTVEDATFSCAFIRIGLIPDTGATFTLPRLVGLRTAKRLTLTGEFFDGEEAADIDLVNDAVEDDDALDESVEYIVGKLSRRPTRTVGMTKQAIHENLDNDWRKALDYENHMQVQAYMMDEHAEGIAAFLEGRDPEWD